MAKVLITGTNSFIGKNFIRYSQNRECDEVSLIDNKPEDIEFKRYSVVLHLAAIVHQSGGIPYEEYLRVNSDLCIRVAEQAKQKGIEQFIFLSTLKVYGETYPETGLMNELSGCYPSDAYGRSKLEAEKRLGELEDDRFKVAIIRPALVYGEGVKANMLDLIRLVERWPLLPFGNISNKRNFVYTENLIAYLDRVIELRSSGIFIAIDPYSISTTDLITYIARYLQRKVLLIHMPPLFVKILKLFIPGIIIRLFGSLEFDNSRTIRLLDFKVPFTTEEGIRRTILAYKGSKTEE